MTGTRAIIHLENLRHNIDIIRQRIGSERKICLPVKANAYGHGMIPVARAALKYGCDYLAVARTSEGRELREAGISGPVLMMGHAPSEELAELAELGLQPYAGSADYLDALDKAARAVLPEEKKLPIHLKIDTGMGRIGCRPEEAVTLARQIFSSERLILAGICTHFPVSDSTDDREIQFTRDQTAALNKAADAIRSLPEAPEDFLVHGANSGALVQHMDSFMDMVRPGIILYGYEPFPGNPLGVLPLMELTSELVFLKKILPGESVSYGRTWRAAKETWIGTVAIGYGDGYSRHLSNRGSVMIKENTYPVIGRICMDQIMVDLGAECRVSLGDRVTLFGPPPCPFSAAAIAEQLDTISYEVCCLITGRVPRVYSD